MYEQYWGLASTPFANRLSEKTFYESQLHEEALARMFYCVEQDKALAILHGPPGCGKSQLLQVLAGQVRRTQRFCAGVNLANLCERDFLGQLEGELRLGGMEQDSPSLRWRRLRDFFQSTCESGLQTVLLLDGLELAEDSSVAAIGRLVELHNQSIAHLTIIASLNPGNRSRSLTDFLELADMGIEVKPLARPETESYVRTRLEASGGRRAVFQAEAIDQVHQLTDGVPREINRLCELAMLAGMAESRTTIDQNLIASLASESARP